MNLTEAQQEAIQQLVFSSNITIQTLQDDVVDHLCCVVELKLSKGKNFETALREALHELAPYGLEKIQEDTVLLLNSTKIIYMKKVMYSIGLISAAAISLGWLFIILHWPGGPELFNSGFLGFLLLFVPMLAIDRYKVNLRKALSEKLKIILGFISAFILGLSLIFKFLHLQGADIMLMAGVFLFTFGFLPFQFFGMYKKSIS